MSDETLGMPQMYEQNQPAVDNSSTTADNQSTLQGRDETSHTVQETNRDNQSHVQKSESEKEQNMRYLRERAESAERRMQELERAMQMNMNQQQTTKMQIVEEPDDFDISDDTYIEGKHLKKYVKSLKNELKETKKQFAEFNQKSAVSQAEMRLKSQFADFDSVVSKDNLEKLASQKPSLFRSIMSNPDIYDQGFTAYEMIKNSGIGANPYQDQDRRIEENRAKPKAAANAPSHTAETPLARVGDYDRRVLTKERKEQLLRQVELAKSYK